MSPARVTFAFLLSPLATPLTFIAFARVEGTYQPEQFLGYVRFIGFFAYLAAMFFGMPAFLLFRALGWTSVFSHALGGAAIGFLVSAFLFGLSLDTPWERAVFIAAGCLSAITFRLILSDLPPRPRMRSE